MPMRVAGVWHGSLEDVDRLVKAVNAWCDCRNTPGRPCGAHQMVLDQRILDHFAFVGQRREYFLRAEFDPAAEWW